MDKIILDACCGSKMMWFDKNNTKTIFMDIRQEDHILCDQRKLIIAPDIVGDFRNIPYPDATFKLVVFDPPHLKKAGKDSWLAKKYGLLSPGWEDDIRKGLKECFRVLQQHGILIFKWNEDQIKVRKILSLTDIPPLFGHTTGRHGKTHWMTFMKE